jgi:hypothetical protein
VEREEIEKEIIEAKEAQTKFLKEVEESLSKIIKI